MCACACVFTGGENIQTLKWFDCQTVFLLIKALLACCLSLSAPFITDFLFWTAMSWCRKGVGLGVVNQVSDSIAPSTVDMVKCKLLHGAAAWEGGRVPVILWFFYLCRTLNFILFPMLSPQCPVSKGQVPFLISPSWNPSFRRLLPRVPHAFKYFHSG